MKNNLVMDFIVDKSNHKILVKREFAAPVKLVWKAWTTPEILDTWWAPKPYQAHTKSMDFREGGSWLYYMKGPDGVVHWCRADYQQVVPEKSFKGLDAFCDEHGKIIEEFPRTEWSCTFESHNNNTLVTIETTYSTLADLEKIIEMGFKEGFTAALENLDAWLLQK